MHEKIVFFRVLEWPKWTDCTDFLKFDQQIARNVQLMFQIVRVFRIFSQQKTFFFDFDWTKVNFCMKIFFKKVSSNWSSAYLVQSELYWVEYSPEVFIREYSPEIHDVPQYKLCSMGIWYWGNNIRLIFTIEVSLKR